MACDKKTYPSKKSAKTAKKKYNKIYKQKITNCYYCEDCYGWHLTTMKKTKSRFLSRINR